VVWLFANTFIDSIFFYKYPNYLANLLPMSSKWHIFFGRYQTHIQVPRSKCLCHQFNVRLNDWYVIGNWPTFLSRSWTISLPPNWSLKIVIPAEIILSQFRRTNSICLYQFRYIFENVRINKKLCFLGYQIVGIKVRQSTYFEVVERTFVASKNNNIVLTANAFRKQIFLMKCRSKLGLLFDENF